MSLKRTPVWALMGPGQDSYPDDWGVRCDPSNLGSSGVATMYLYGEIGPWGVRAKDVLQVLGELTGPVEVHVNSMGGSVFEGLAIYQAFREYPHNVTMVVDGLAASAASFILMAGNTIEVGLAAHVMIHEASALCMGTAADMRGTAEMLTKCTASIASLYAKRSGVEASNWLAAMADETWYVGQEAIDAGLADAIRGDDATEPDFGNAATLTATGVNAALSTMLSALADPPVMRKNDGPDSIDGEDERERPVETDGNTPKNSSPGEDADEPLNWDALITTVHENAALFSWLNGVQSLGLFDHLTEGAAQ